MSTEVRKITRPFAPEWVKAQVQSNRWLISTKWPVAAAYLALIFGLVVLIGVLESATPMSGKAWIELIPRAATVAALAGAAILLVAIVATWCFHAAQAARGRAVMWVIDDGEGWASVIANRSRKDPNTWVVWSLLAIPAGQYRGALVGRVLLDWADANEFALEATARSRALARAYTRGRVGFTEQRVNVWGKVRVRREPESGRR